MVPPPPPPPHVSVPEADGGDTVTTDSPTTTPLNPEEAISSINKELSKALSHSAQLENQNHQLKNTVLQLETKIATGICFPSFVSLALTFVLFFNKGRGKEFTPKSLIPDLGGSYISNLSILICLESFKKFLWWVVGGDGGGVLMWI